MSRPSCSVRADDQSKRCGRKLKGGELSPLFFHSDHFARFVVDYTRSIRTAIAQLLYRSALLAFQPTPHSTVSRFPRLSFLATDLPGSLPATMSLKTQLVPNSLEDVLDFMDEAPIEPWYRELEAIHQLIRIRLREEFKVASQVRLLETSIRDGNG